MKLSMLDVQEANMELAKATARLNKRAARRSRVEDAWCQVGLVVIYAAFAWMLIGLVMWFFQAD